MDMDVNKHERMHPEVEEVDFIAHLTVTMMSLMASKYRTANSLLFSVL